MPINGENILGKNQNDTDLEFIGHLFMVEVNKVD